MDWKLELPDSIEHTKLKATLELCNVPPLGYFLEIEILSPSKKDEDVKKVQQILFELLEKCGIEKSCIEEKYYSELLSQIEKIIKL